MKYRKKPVVIEAFRLAIDKPCDWWYEKGNKWSLAQPQGEIPEILLNTLEGTMRAVQGDYIIRGVKGELYPCKADIFEMTYEVVNDDA